MEIVRSKITISGLKHACSVYGGGSMMWIWEESMSQGKRMILGATKLERLCKTNSFRHPASSHEISKSKWHHIHGNRPSLNLSGLEIHHPQQLESYSKSYLLESRSWFRCAFITTTNSKHSCRRSYSSNSSQSYTTTHSTVVDESSATNVVESSQSPLQGILMPSSRLKFF